MVDFSKHKHGDVVVVHCCDECARKAGVKPKRPADSGKASWLCDVCGHHRIGSLTDCEIGDATKIAELIDEAGKRPPKPADRPPHKLHLHRFTPEGT
jgi:ribosomal protein L37AE/L43A